MTGVSFVVPIRNGAPWIRDVIGSIDSQGDGRPLENHRRGRCQYRRLARDRRGPLDGPSPPHHRWRREWSSGRNQHRGPRHAVPGESVRSTRTSCSSQGWMRALTRELEDPKVAAAQGYYTTPE